ncbi:hypothetical protein AJ80_00094 [Polytolypa hystricis UAMH7299]|uniref:Uncharacterized protein n=1 Tax=Polytolypa hystricis (strain UAMH7299) TaxID=1447883 RepID=A0A2B7YVU1_POLH7|nr:hypothetical protein AJ80_00094 [Polytolypa hystricis UAMH7299]
MIQFYSESLPAGGRNLLDSPASYILIDLVPTQSPSVESSQTKLPLDNCDISKVSDETLTALFDTAPIIHSYQGTHIVRLSQTLVLKGGLSARPCEASIVKLVSTEAGSAIVVPKVHRALNIETEMSSLDASA